MTTKITKKEAKDLVKYIEENIYDDAKYCIESFKKYGGGNLKEMRDDIQICALEYIEGMKQYHSDMNPKISPDFDYSTIFSIAGTEGIRFSEDMESVFLTAKAICRIGK